MSFDFESATVHQVVYIAMMSKTEMGLPMARSC